MAKDYVTEAEERQSGSEWREKYAAMDSEKLIEAALMLRKEKAGVDRRVSSLETEIGDLKGKLDGETDLHAKSVDDLREYAVNLKVREGRLGQRERALERALNDEIPLSLAVQLVGDTDDVTDKNIDTLISEIDRVAGNRVEKILGSNPRPQAGDDKRPLSVDEINRLAKSGKKGLFTTAQFKAMTNG